MGAGSLFGRDPRKQECRNRDSEAGELFKGI